MASSTTRTTEIEAILRYHFKTSFAFLWSNNLRIEAEGTGQLFANALEMTWPELLDMLKPGVDLTARQSSEKGGCAGGTTAAKFRSGNEFWMKMNQRRWKLARSAQIAVAGDALSDAGAALFKVGRDGEAGAFCEWGEYLVLCLTKVASE